MHEVLSCALALLYSALICSAKICSVQLCSSFLWSILLSPPQQHSTLLYSTLPCPPSFHSTLLDPHSLTVLQATSDTLRRASKEILLSPESAQTTQHDASLTRGGEKAQDWEGREARASHPHEATKV